MVLVRLQGGLGNQMFQYAAGLRLAITRRTELKLDLAGLLDRRVPQAGAVRDYDLHLFKIREEVATPREVRSFLRIGNPGSRTILERLEDKFVRRCLFHEQTLNFDPQVLQLSGKTYLDGYFQNENYFADIESIIRERFRFPISIDELPEHTKTLAARIRTMDSVCIHVRRGDYVSNPAAFEFHGTCGPEYYATSAAWVAGKIVAPTFFIFSDDLEWCRANLQLPDAFIFVGPEYDGPKFFHKFWLMSQCKHFVISNSSFGWWAAWLATNAGKLVARPSAWFKSPDVRDVDICPPSWMRIM
jgi:hypothetical protein